MKFILISTNILGAMSTTMKSAIQTMSAIVRVANARPGHCHVMLV
jgi:hypothetical protein